MLLNQRSLTRSICSKIKRVEWRLITGEIKPPTSLSACSAYLLVKLVSNVLLRVNKVVSVTGHIKVFGNKKYISATSDPHDVLQPVKDEMADYRGLSIIQQHVIQAILTLIPDNDGGVYVEDISKAVQDGGQLTSPNAVRFVLFCFLFVIAVD